MWNRGKSDCSPLRILNTWFHRQIHSFILNIYSFLFTQQQPNNCLVPFLSFFFSLHHHGVLCFGWFGIMFLLEYRGDNAWHSSLSLGVCQSIFSFNDLYTIIFIISLTTICFTGFYMRSLVRPFMFFHLRSSLHTPNSRAAVSSYKYIVSAEAQVINTHQ